MVSVMYSSCYLCCSLPSVGSCICVYSIYKSHCACKCMSSVQVSLCKSAGRLRKRYTSTNLIGLYVIIYAAIVSAIIMINLHGM